MSDRQSVAVISGGTRGIGLEIARFLASRGWQIGICSRSGPEATEVSIDLTREFGVSSVGSATDVANPNAVEVFAQVVRRDLGRPCLVICNAAVLGPVGGPTDALPEDWSAALHVNVSGVYNMINAFWTDVTSQPDGRIITMSGGGVGGPRPLRKTTAYVASKAALASLVETLSYEMQGTSSTINSIAPGAVPTTFMDGVLRAGRDLAGDDLFADAASRIGQSTTGTLTDFFRLLTYVISPESREISGRTLSARWNNPEELACLGQLTEDANLYRLRRIDNQLFTEEVKE